MALNGMCVEIKINSLLHKLFWVMYKNTPKFCLKDLQIVSIHPRCKNTET